MDSHKREKIARLVKEGRTGKGYTQQELSEIAGLSLRSIQRIENAEVLPRMYTLKLLSRHLDFSLEMLDGEPFSPGMAVQQSGSEPSPLNVPVSRQPNHQQKIILTFGIGAVLALLLMAFLAQSPGFPETDFELFLLLVGVIGCYILTLLIIWR
ncbi:helix-turn-helix transcriptional regulator [Compostibacter hankyongensis]|uniref:HTH cro/C1-type domain-containing protein n=1 Tax=Compostibacter hankyongensis TaxID=1007089 RepID=A0ABP8G9T6_9BACT